MLLRWHRAPFPKGPPKSSVGGTPGWNRSSSARRHGWPPPGVFVSVRRDFRPGLSSASRASGVTKLPLRRRTLLNEEEETKV